MFFGTLNPLLEREIGFSYPCIGGDYVFYIEFINALITHGSFDEYHFFVDGENFLKSMETKENMLPRNEKAKRIKIKKICELPISLKKNRYMCFYDTNFIEGFLRLVYLRNQFSHHPFPITATIHAVIFQEFIYNYFLDLTSNIYPFDSIICVSSQAQISLKKIFEDISNKSRDTIDLNLDYPGRLDKIPIGVDTDLFMPQDKLPLRKKLNLPENKIIVLSLSRLTPSTKMDLYPLILLSKDALFNTPEGKDVILVLAGKHVDGYTQECMNLVDKLGLTGKIRFYIDLPRIAIPILYAASDIFISPSDTIGEIFGLTVLEAMASGLPVVVSDFNGYKEIVQDQETGFKAPTLWASIDKQISSLAPLRDLETNQFLLSQSFCVDIEKMLDCIKLLVKNEILREEMGKNARKYAVESFDWRVIIPRYEALWKKLYGLSKDYQKAVKAERDQFIFKPAYFKNTNSHFCPNIVVDRETILLTSDYGEKVLNEKSGLFLHTKSRSLISETTIKGILKITNNYTRTGTIIECLIRDNKEIEEDDILYHIMWMLKYGLLKIK